jgi:hypothetical protein
LTKTVRKSRSAEQHIARGGVKSVAAVASARTGTGGRSSVCIKPACVINTREFGGSGIICTVGRGRAGVRVWWQPHLPAREEQVQVQRLLSESLATSATSSALEVHYHAELRAGGSQSEPDGDIPFEI